MSIFLTGGYLCVPRQFLEQFHISVMSVSWSLPTWAYEYTAIVSESARAPVSYPPFLEALPQEPILASSPYFTSAITI